MDDLIYNGDIRNATVRLIDDEKNFRILSTRDALLEARKNDLDLVVIAGGDVPVCRIVDIAKFRYERKQFEREQSRKQRDLAIETKEIQLRPVTDSHDIGIKAKKAREFLDDGDKVKVIVRFKGRERTHRDYGRNIMDQFLAIVGDHKLERPMNHDGGDMMVLLAPTMSKADIKRKKQV